MIYSFQLLMTRFSKFTHHLFFSQSTKSKFKCTKEDLVLFIYLDGVDFSMALLKQCYPRGKVPLVIKL